MPAAMLESYVEKWPTPSLDNFRYMLRSGMMGWLTIMLDTTAWSGEQHDAAKREIVLYQQRLRPLIRDAELFHISARPDGVHWDGMEYWDPARGTGAVFAFRGSIADEAEHRYKLAGLKGEALYALHFEDGSQANREATGGELMGDGLRVRLEHPLSSEIVFLTEVPLKAAQQVKE
jgi:alpha-galactosidase